jgi:hypothetical protein
MWRGLRSPLFLTGVALVLLGGGNWINGQVKLGEYDALGEQSLPAAAVAAPEGYRHLTARTNANLLRPLQHRLTERSHAERKRDFYRLVLAGGRLLTLFGVFMVAVGLWRERQRPGRRDPVGAFS